MSAPAQPAEPSATPARDPIAFTLIGAVILFLVLELGVTWLAGRIDPTWSALVASAAMVGLALVLERLFFKRAPLAALHVLGYNRLDLPSLVVAGCVTLVMSFRSIAMPTSADMPLLDADFKLARLLARLPL